MLGTWSFSGLEVSDDASDLIRIGCTDERVFVAFCRSKFFDGSSDEVHVLVVYVKVDVCRSLVFQTVGEGGGFVLICEDDAVVRAVDRWKWPLVASQRFGHFPGRSVHGVQGF